MSRMFLIGAVLIGVAGAAHARDHSGYQAISTGDLVTAEQRIQAERRIFPARPELLLNLAAIYARTGRQAQAVALYDATLGQPDVMMELPNGVAASSHSLAAAGRLRLHNIVSAVR